MRGVVQVTADRGWKVIGFADGYEGMTMPMRYRKLDPNGIHNIMPMDGRILGTTNRGRSVAEVGEGNRAGLRCQGEVGLAASASAWPNNWRR